MTFAHVDELFPNIEEVAPDAETKSSTQYVIREVILVEGDFDERTETIFVGDVVKIEVLIPVSAAIKK